MLTLQNPVSLAPEGVGSIGNPKIGASNISWSGGSKCLWVSRAASNCDVRSEKRGNELWNENQT